MNNVNQDRSESKPPAPPRQSRPAPGGAPPASDAPSVSVKVSVDGSPVSPAPKREDGAAKVAPPPAAPAAAPPKSESEAKVAQPGAEPKNAIEPDPKPHRPLAEVLSPNVAGMLCYLFGWVSGLIFLLIDKRPFVRFHAAQSVVVFATLSLALLVLSGFFFAKFAPGLGGVLLVLRRIVELTWLVAAVVLMLKAASGDRYHAPYAGGYAEKAAQTRG